MLTVPLTCRFRKQFRQYSQRTVSNWESGASEPSTTNLMKVARLYGVDPAELLREVEG
ncbi:MAG TPA: helix-turn-helix domain-containing protein [Candidatus Olsenella excrementigallinarum]|nr:helix-turn-helix domain-containing protein [Candidatus Olsenella excrementigallinarum]